MGGGKKQKAPAAPDYAALQQSDALANRETAQELTRWNRPTQVDQYGNTLNWSQDAQGNWTQSQTMNPLIKAGQDQALAAYLKASQEASNQGSFQAPSYDMVNNRYWEAIGNGNFDPNAYGSIGEFDRTQGDKVASDMYESSMSRLRPQQEQDVAAIDSKLRQQGLQPGTEAYDRAMKNMTTSQGDVNSKLALDSTSAGYNAAMGIYNTNLGGQNQRFNQGLEGYNANTDQDWKAFQGALGSQDQQYAQAMASYNLPMERAQAASQLFSQAPGSNWQGFGTASGYAPADMTGAANASYQAKMGGYNSGQNKKNSMMGAGTSLGSAFLGSK
jgi:hypothetical protein